MPTLSATFLRQLREKDACPAGRTWARTNKATGFADAWTRLSRPDWMLWLAEKFGVDLDLDLVLQFAFECADRAVRIHAVGALSSAGLTAEAEQLGTIAPITDRRAAEAATEAAWAAEAATEAAWAAKEAARAAGAARDTGAARADAEAAWAAKEAARAAEAAWAAKEAARAAGAARDAAEAATEAAWAAWDAAEAAAWADTWAAEATEAVGDAIEVERQWGADRLRVIFPMVGADR